MSPPDDGPGAEQALGGRLPLRDPGALAGEAKALYDRVVKTAVPWSQKAGFESRTPDGRLIGPFNVILFSPRLGRRCWTCRRRRASTPPSATACAKW